MRYFLIFLYIIIHSQIFLNIGKTEDITISSNHSSQIVMSNNDTLTVESGVTIDTSAAEPVELENHTFSTSSTTITNNGTIVGTTKAIEADKSTDFSINNSGTISVSDNANSPGSALSLLQSRGTVSIVNSGTLESERADTIKLHPSYGTVTINNSGSITSSKDRTINFGQHANAGTIINSGTISGRANTLYIYSSGTDHSAGTITNSGTISASGGNGFEINNVNDVTITNTGTISATADAIYNIGENSSNGNIIINKGTISSGASNHDLIVTTSVGLQSLTNDQGGNDALKLEGYLPVNYVFLANSTTDYGKLAVDSQNGATTFSISTDSSLSAGTYASVITGVSSNRFTAGSTGTCSCSNGNFNWTLSETSSGSTNWNLVITNVDQTAPTLSSSSPSDNATGVATNANIVLTFNEAVDAESGNITIKKTSDNSTIETIDVTGAKVSGSGSTEITINPGTDWSEKTEYYILIDATAFDDTAGNSYAGISSTTTLSFTTVDETNPTLSSSSPSDNATSVALNANIVLTFNEAVDAESGNITIKKTSDNSTIETIDVTGVKVSGSGSTEITINPGTDWSEQTEFYVLIDATAFDDTAGNSYAGISSTTTLSFTTGDETNPTLSSSSPSDNATGVATNANIVLTFNEAVDAESGNITIKKTSDNSTIETIDVTGAKVSGSGSTEITINPDTDLIGDVDYYILIDATAFDDTAGNSYTGISSTTALNFSVQPGEVFNETVKTLTKNQTVAAISSLNQSLNRIAGRMNYIRSTNNNSSNQNIRLAMDLDNPFVNEILNSLSSKLLKKQKDTQKWGVWSEGNISYGRIGEQDGNLGQDIHSDGITFGIDKRINEDKTIGFALNKSWQETKVGSNEANMDAAAISIMNYTSFKIEDKRYLEIVAGIGEMDIDLSRDVTVGKNTGNRKGNQFFGSFTYLLEPDVEVVGRNLNYYTRLDLGFTQLKAYTETGDGTAVSYKKQNVKSLSLSTGLNLSKIIETDKATLEPSLKFELGKDKTINSVSEAYYVNNASEIYSNAIGDQSSEHLLFHLGIGAKFKNELTINTSYEHYRSTDDAFNNNFSIYVRKPL